MQGFNNELSIYSVEDQNCFMKKITTLSIFFFLCIVHSWSQKEDPIIHRVFTFAGEEVVGSDLTYESPILQPSFFKLDERRFETKDVYQFQNNNGFFTNLSKIHGEKTERYALRTQQGKIDIYEEIDMVIYGGPSLALQFPEDDVNSSNPELASGNYVQYYAKNGQPISKATYKNLKADLSDNTTSDNLMRKFNRMRWLQYGMIAGGAALIAGGMGALDPEEMKMTPMIALGIVLGGGSYLLENPKENAIWNAVQAYNQ
jgi:hypothetical protein